MATKEEWVEFEAQHPLRMVEELLSGEELDKESMESTEEELFDGCYFSPKEFEWTAALKDARPFVLAKAGEEVNTKLEDDIKELQAAVEDLGTLHGLLAKASREDSLEVLAYVWILVAEVIKAIDRLNKRVLVWKEVLGDPNFWVHWVSSIPLSLDSAGAWTTCRQDSMCGKGITSVI